MHREATTRKSNIFTLLSQPGKLFSFPGICPSIHASAKSHGHNMTNYGPTTVLEVMTEFAHNKGGFWRQMCDLGIFSQPACRGIVSTLQH